MRTLSCVAVVLALCLRASEPAQAQANAASAAQIMQADRDFAKSVAERNREKFLSFIAETTTFNGGTRNELRGRDAVMKDWDAFFDPKGPSLTWAPIRGDVIGAGDVGYTVGRSLFTTTGTDGKITERPGEYLTIWRKQADGAWKVVFDTGSSLPPGR